ncbi:MAG: hypothetical protein MK179_22375 [Pirellulaceae bacterium]|nr:hypothetical protein [Pirellulaceae bacterium]
MNFLLVCHAVHCYAGSRSKLLATYPVIGLFRLLLVLCCLACFQVCASGQQADSFDTSGKVKAEAAGVKHDEAIEEQSAAGDLVLVVGAAGTEEFGVAFQLWGERWRKISEQSDLKFVPIGLTGKAGEVSDRDLLRETLTARPENQSTPLWLVLIGHGTYARDVAKFNLRGPDVSGTDLANWMAGTKRPIVIINCASASGPFVNRLSGPKRVVVTATRSGIEQNYARFGDFLSEAIGSPESDLDHDGEVSIHEAFLRASAGVRMFYESEDRIVTEHAIIDDNGDGKGTPATMFRGVRPSSKAKDGVALDGAAALRITMTPSGGRLPFTAGELKERAKIEDQIETLRGRVGELDRGALDAALLPLMLRLARLYQAVQEREPTPQP